MTVDSPLPTEEPQPLYFVLAKGYSAWHVWRDMDDANLQYVTPDLAEVERMLVKAKKQIAKHSTVDNLAASSLRIAVSTNEEL